MEITVLCKVVDNFGDIGVVWRLCRNLKSKNPEILINLVVDDLGAFEKICRQVDSKKSFQQIQGVDIYDSNDGTFCTEKFSGNDGEKLSVILECFQCGRPDWMEKILFEKKLNRTVQIIMIDYLTAEKYAEDFHCLKSLTRSAKVQKVNFMPGFTAKTGGLIIDAEWKNLCEYQRGGAALVFLYERNWQPLANALNRRSENQKARKVLLAQGRGLESVKSAAESVSGRNFDFEVLDFLNQEDWDKMMKFCSVLFVRGEESMSRACLSGIPFVWQAYPQSNEYQLVKVNALLERMERHFKRPDFEIIRRVWLDFNSPENSVAPDVFERDCVDFMGSAARLVYGYRDFALDLRKNGDLCDNLMTFIRKITIID